MTPKGRPRGPEHFFPFLLGQRARGSFPFPPGAQLFQNPGWFICLFRFTSTNKKEQGVYLLSRGRNCSKNCLHHTTQAYIVHVPWQGPTGLYFAFFPMGIAGGPCRRGKERMRTLKQLHGRQCLEGAYNPGKHGEACWLWLIKMFPSLLFICSLKAILQRRLLRRESGNKEL